MTEYCRYGDLRSYIERNGLIAEPLGMFIIYFLNVFTIHLYITASQIIEQCIRGVQYLHDKGIIHRDLSAGNVLITSERPTIYVVCILGLINDHMNFRKSAISVWQQVMKKMLKNIKQCAERRIICRRTFYELPYFVIFCL